MVKILLIEGGGKKGALPMATISNINDYLLRTKKTTVPEYFDFIIGQSVGGIITGALAAGATVEYMYNNFEDICEDGFKRSFKTFFKPGKYSHEHMQDVLGSKVISKSMLMEDAVFNLGIGSIDKNSKPDKNVMFTKRNAGKRTILDIVGLTYAAPIYFGYKYDPVFGKTYADAGTGIHNTPIQECLNMIAEQYPELKDEHKHIVSLGTGNNYNEGNPRKFGSLREGVDFLGLGREQAENSQIRFINNYSNMLNTTLYHFDIDIKKKYDKLDKGAYNYYYDKGHKMFEFIEEGDIDSILI